MSQGLKRCPGCGNPHPDVTSGVMVICDECGECASYDNWQAGRADSPFKDEDDDDEPDDDKIEDSLRELMDYERRNYLGDV